MSDREILSDTPLDFAGLTLARAAPAVRFVLRARDPAQLAALIGRALPARIGETCDGIAMLGPDEYYARLPADTVLPRGDGAALSIVEVSSRAIGISLNGARAAEVLGAGCPLDLDHFAIGRTTRTLFETVEMIVSREAEDRFHIEVWRSFAPWLWQAFAAAARG